MTGSMVNITELKFQRREENLRILRLVALNWKSKMAKTSSLLWKVTFLFLMLTFATTSVLGIPTNIADITSLDDAEAERLVSLCCWCNFTNDKYCCSIFGPCCVNGSNPVPFVYPCDM